jgi:hypothetical protein
MFRNIPRATALTLSAAILMSSCDLREPTLAEPAGHALSGGDGGATLVSTFAMPADIARPGETTTRTSLRSAGFIPANSYVLLRVGGTMKRVSTGVKTANGPEHPGVHH